MALPYPGMDFTSLDILTAADMDKIVANIEYVNSLHEKKFVVVDGNSATYTATVYMIPGKTTGFLHQLTIQTLNHAKPQMYAICWTKAGNAYISNLGPNASLTSVEIISTNEANATAVLKFTFDESSYSGVRIVSLG